MELPLELTAMEVLLLTDRTRNEATDDGQAIGKPLLLKLGSAYLEMVGDNPKLGTVTLYLTEREAWHARSLFNSGDRCDADSKLGVHLLRKLYTLLLAFDAADRTGAVPDAVDGDRTFKESLPHGWRPREFGWDKAPTKADTDWDDGQLV